MEVREKRNARWFEERLFARLMLLGVSPSASYDGNTDIRVGFFQGLLNDLFPRWSFGLPRRGRGRPEPQLGGIIIIVLLAASFITWSCVITLFAAAAPL